MALERISLGWIIAWSNCRLDRNSTPGETALIRLGDSLNLGRSWSIVEAVVHQFSTLVDSFQNPPQPPAIMSGRPNQFGTAWPSGH